MLSPRRLGLLAAVILLPVLVGLSPSAPSRGSTLSGDPALAGRGATGSGPVVAYEQAPPRIDAEGYTVWGGPVDYGNGAGVQPWFCVDLSNIVEYPIYLGDQDPTEISDLTLTLMFDEYRAAPYDVDIYDPFWYVVLNGQRRLEPPIWAPTEHGEAGYSWKTATLDVDSSMLIEGQNGFRLANDDAPWGGDDPRSHPTCIVLYSFELRGKVGEPHIKVIPERLSPRPEAKNVDPRKSKADIRVEFTKPVSETTVNKDTFQVYYLDPDLKEVYVDGEVKVNLETGMSAKFVPDADLRDGIEYHARIIGENEAKEEDRDRWVRDALGDSLEDGYAWSFWTMPNLQVRLVPVQVIEEPYNPELVVGKPTALKTFVRWDSKPDVFKYSQLQSVDLYDVKVQWATEAGVKPNEISWRATNGANWVPASTAKNPALKRKREYMEFVGEDESYTKNDKLKSRDSVTYTRFYPEATEAGFFNAVVELESDKGKTVAFQSGYVMYHARVHDEWNTYFSAIRVGSWETRTTPVNLWPLANTSRIGIRSIFPVPYVRPFGGTGLYSAKPLATTRESIVDLLGQMSRLCDQTDGCNVMFGVVPEDFMDVNGIVSVEYTVPLIDISLGVDRSRRGSLLNDRISRNHNLITRRYIAAHESGHMQDQPGADWDDEDPPEPAAEGFDVVAKEDRRRSAAILPERPSSPLESYNFMKRYPFVENNYLWIKSEYYYNLLNRNFHPSSMALQSTTSLPRVMVAGTILTTTNSVTLDPFYLLPPGAWTAPTISGTFSLAFLDASANTLASYPFSPALDDATSNRAGFDFVVPFPTGTTRIQIRRNGTLIKDVTASANAPSLNVTAPAAGNTWTGDRTVTWSASDADGDALHYAVQVSADNGAHWQAVATDITQTSFLWNTGSVTNTAQARVRVMATDGLRSTAATAGPFTVSNPPTVTLASPSIGITNAHTFSPIILAFSDDMAPTSLTTGTITLRGPSPTPLSGTITYDAVNYEATFSPAGALAYSTSYTVTVTTGARTKSGAAIPANVSFSFRTEDDPFPPEPVAFSPLNGAMRVPINASLAVAWDKDLKAGTINPISFTLATTAGVPVAGAVAYDSASRTATFRPNANLAPRMGYVATLKAGIQDIAGNATVSDRGWFFRTVSETLQSVAFTGAFADYAADDNADGLDDRLIIRVGVQVTATGTYYLGGTLVDASGEEIARVYTGSAMQPGARFLDLTFPGAQIGGHGVDGPFTLTGLLFYKTDDPRLSARLDDAYRTSAYAASRFYARLTLSGLPDVNLLPGTSRDHVFNVRDYARHVSLGSSQLTYSITVYTSDKTGVTLGSDGYINIHPWSDWTGSSRITVRAAAGNDFAEDTFEVNVGLQYRVNLPVVLKGYDGSSSYSPARSDWKTVFSESFENALPATWALWSMTSGLPGQILKVYSWDRRNCMASSGSYSGWPYGGNDDGSLLSCGADYPNGYIGAIGYRPNINLKYVGQAEFRMKVWTDLDLNHDWRDFNEGDKICAMVSTDPYGEFNQKRYYGVCKTGKSQGWEDLVLDLSNVPTLGNVLGGDQVWVAVKFFSDSSLTKPNGAFVDDISLRICPAGLTCR